MIKQAEKPAPVDKIHRGDFLKGMQLRRRGPGPRRVIRKPFHSTFTLAAIIVAGSLIHPFGNPSSGGVKTAILSGAEIDPETLKLIQRACQNCHSLNTELPLYGRIAPISWLMARDIQQARLHMNLSRWQEYSPEDRLVLLSAIGSAVKNREMPFQRYLILHSEARLSNQEREQVYRWSRAERKRLKSARAPTGAERQEHPERLNNMPRLLFAQSKSRTAVGGNIFEFR
jgi:hypothetical protein